MENPWVGPMNPGATSPTPSAARDAGDILRSAGEGLGSFLAGIPPALVNFFSGVAAGAGLHGVVDWGAMLLGLTHLAVEVCQVGCRVGYGAHRQVAQLPEPLSQQSQDDLLLALCRPSL